MSGDEDALDWGALVPRLVYPTKLWIIEAILWTDEPLSATQLEQVFGKTMSLSSISYHVVTLVKLGVLRQYRSRRVRGGVERFYSFTDAVQK